MVISEIVTRVLVYTADLIFDGTLPNFFTV